MGRSGRWRPAWMCAGCEDLQLTALVASVPSRAAALAAEALMTSHRWIADKAATRGGPWCKPILSRKDVAELTRIARCRSLAELFEAATAMQPGSLSCHLKNLVYSSSSSTTFLSGHRSLSTRTTLPMCPRRRLPCPRPSPTALSRVCRARSGKSGYAWRQANGIKFGTERHSRAKWGSEGLVAKRRHQREWKARP